METMMDNCNPDTGLYPDGSGGGTCNGTKPTCDGKTATTPNRWGTEVTALTGSFANNAYYCLDMPRTLGSAFDNEYSLQYAAGTVHPYDINYYLDYHRPAQFISGTQACVYGFSQNATTGWYPDNSVQHQENPSSGTSDFSAAQIQGYVYDITTNTPVLTGTGAKTPCSGGFLQNSDGLINLAQNAVRFGMMTFDTDIQPGTGVTGVADSASTLNLTFNDVANVSPTNTVSSGMWSYFSGWEQSTTGASVGRPAGCAESGLSLIPYEVGARNPAAPPWEGRLMRFPTTYAAPATSNAQVMQAILAMRPYGANPIAGMMDDAKYYLWQDPEGPQNADSLAACRQSYIILLSHAAPNEDLQTYCQGTASGFAGICPYDYPEYIAAGLASGTYNKGAGVTNSQSATAGGYKVKTFVIGFSASSNLTSGGASCNDVIVNGSIDTTKCGNEELNGTDAGAGPSSTYAACCALARIAVSGGTGTPYFADSAAGLNAAFRAILAQIVANATTRATPVLMPQAATAQGASALFLSSFVPSKVAPWSGDVQRQRYQCSTGSNGQWGPQQQAVSATAGDDFQNNLQSSQSSIQRNVILVEPYPPPPTATPARSATGYGGVLRPYVNGPGAPAATGTAFDGYTMYDGTEYGYSYVPGGASAVAANLTTQITPDVLFPSGCTFKQSGSSTAFSTADCETIAFNYAMGVQYPPSSWQTNLSSFPSRYYDPSQKVVSSPFGGVYHSTPAIATPPSSLIRDDSYQAFLGTYTTNYTTSNGKTEPRHTVLYVATTDGLLHAFGVDYNATDPYTFNGSNHTNEAGTSGLMNEMWSFIPPAVMPQLINGLGGSQNVLLDGAPVVKDTVYQRAVVGSGEDWHTSVVAGFGQAMGGYYALDVTDPDFTQRGSSGTSFGPTHSSANTNTPPYMSSTTAKPQGPHFLWQFTDPTLFAQKSGIPAITTVYVKDPDNNNKLTEVGVAVLPGGYSTPSSTSTGCARTNKVSDASPITPHAYALGAKVRAWGSGGCPTTTAPARGRSLTIVRLDNGEVLRSFAQMSDLPSTFPLYNGDGGTSSTNPAGYAYHGRVTQADFDSPVSGTPVAYPADVGALAQKIFVGDQDGTIWRVNVSDTTPTNWYVEPFIDAYNGTLKAASGLTDDAWAATERAPIVGAPTVSVGRDGNLVLNFGTGDLDLIGQASNKNYVYSVSEEPNATVAKFLATVNWYELLPGAGEMVAGPSVVFDGAYYFATFSPGTGSGTCPNPSPYLWGMDFVNAADSTGAVATASPGSNGGVGKLIDTSQSTNNGVVQKLVQQGTAIIPGVTITSNSACATTTATTDPATGGMSVSVSNVNPASYSVSGLVGSPPSSSSSSSGSNGANVGQVNQLITSVHTATLVDSWASIVE
jgi:type IV pilus assembly protein PilY1